MVTNVTRRAKKTKLFLTKSAFKKYSRAYTILLTGSLSVVFFGGCAVFRAGGDTVEAIGEGATTAFVGLASGTGHAIAGTGRAISSAAGSTSQSVDDFAQLSETAEDRRQPVY